MELLREALAIMGFDTHFKTDTWAVVKQDLVLGNIEVLPLVGRTPEREHEYDFTFPYITMHGALVVHKTEQTITSIQDLNNKRIGVLKGDNAEEYINREQLGAIIVATNTFSEALQLLDEQKLDGVIIQHYLALQLIQDLDLKHVKILKDPIPNFRQDFCFAVKDGNSSLLSLLNEGLSLIIKNKTYEKLYDTWFNPVTTLSTQFDRIIVGGDKDYPPYEFLDKNGEPTGFNVDLTKAIAEELNIEVDIALEQWSKTYTDLLDNKVDIIQGVFYSQERDAFLSFSQPHSMVSHVIVTRKHEFTDIESMQDLKGLSILVMDQDIMHNKVLEFGYEKNTIPVASQEEALLLLSQGAADCAITANMPTHYWMELNKLQNLEIRTTIASDSYCYATIEGGEQEHILQKFSEGLARLEANGTYYEIYQKWFGIYEEENTSLLTIFIRFFYVFIPILFLVFLGLFWSFLLRKKVRQRTAELQLTTEHLQLEILKKEEAEQSIIANEAKFREYIENSPIGIFVCDILGQLFEINEAFMNTTGFSQEELMQKRLPEIAFETGTQEPTQILSALQKQGKTSRVLLFQRKNKTVGYWNFNAIKINNNRFLCFTTDLTELKETEQELFKEKELLKTTLSCIDEGVITTDIDGSIILMNHFAETLTGWKETWGVGKHLQKVFSVKTPNNETKLYNPVMEVLSSGKEVQLKEHPTLTSRNGNHYIIAVSSAPITDQKSQIIGVVIVFRDLTEEYRLQEKLQQTAKLDSLGILAGGIAHDFNNLLSGLFGYIQLAKLEADEGRSCVSYLDEVLKVFDRAKDLTQQLLTFSRGGQPVLKSQKIGKLIQDSVNFALSGSNISCSFSIPPDLWICNIDSHQIEQVIDNMVINAVQAMSDGGELQVQASNIYLSNTHESHLPEGEYIEISITDSGPGIPEHILPKIFDPFFTTKQTGSGLGLATSYSIIAKHKGTIIVHSEMGKGTTFSLYLPRSSEKTLESIFHEPVFHKGSGKILIMDDEKIIRDVISNMLKSMGYTAIGAKDGEEVLTLCKSIHEKIDTGDLKETGFGAAIFDLTIPGGMGGKDTVAEIRKTCPDIPVFACSGYSEDAVMANPEAYGFTGSITKPFKKEELAALLDKHLKNSKTGGSEN